WGRYIYPQQFENSSVNILHQIENLLDTMFEWRFSFWELIGCPCEECMSLDNIENDRDYDIESNLKDYISKIKRYNIGTRVRPSYSFVYDIDNDITIIKSKSLVDYLRIIIKIFDYNPQKIKGINGNIYVDSNTFNFASYEALKEIEKVRTTFDINLQSKKNKFIVIENFIINVDEEYIITKSVSSEIDAFKQEKELIRERHNLESSILFPVPIFEWL